MTQIITMVWSLYLEPDILECEVKWALESITMNKAGGGNGIPVELFKILEDDAVKVLHSICQQIWTQWTWVWVWVDSGSWWWTGRPGMLWSMGSQRVGRKWVTELNRTCRCPSLGLEWKLTFSSPVATAEFSKFADILSAALSQHHLLVFEITQLVFHHFH